MPAVYNTGRYEEPLANADFRPYLQRVGIMDTHIRPSHAALHGYTARIDDPVWQFMYPPDGYHCRCSVRALSQADVDKRGVTIQHSEIVEVEQAWGPNDSRRASAIKWNGQLYTPVAGFGHSPGQGYLAALGQLRHVVALPPQMVDRLSEKGMAVESAVITLTDENLLHALRDSKDAQLPESLWQCLPEFILNPRAIFYNTQKADAALTYVLDLPDTSGKLVVFINSKLKV